MDDRGLFTSDHETFRAEVRRFVENEVLDHHYQWEQEQGFPRDLWHKAGELGFLCCDVPEAFGGAGADWLYNAVVVEEFWKLGASGPGGAFLVHNDVVAPYLLAGASDHLKCRWLPKMISGEAVGALGMTEPSGGSDVQNIRTTAVRKGDEFIVNGQKIFISNGFTSDFVVLACKTDPTAGAKGISLLLVEANSKGFEKGRKLQKIGMHAADQAELFFEDVRVPASNLIGEENQGFKVLMGNLARERLIQAVRSTTVCEAAIEWTVRYTRERRAFGQAIADFQNTQFVLADLDARTSAARVYTDWCMRRHMEGQLDPVHAAKIKLISTELQGELLDKCLQFFGGYGFMREYPIARAFCDARMTRIGGGTVEIMKQIIGKALMKRFQ